MRPSYYFGLHKTILGYLMRLAVVYLLMLMTLQACSIFQIEEENWPANLPEQEHFVNLYRRDTLNISFQNENEYLNWVIRFYQGTNLYPNGWLNISNHVIEKFADNASSAEEIKAKMHTLGLLISGEWAKNNKTRLITSRHVAIWGHALQKSTDQNEILTVLNQVNTDVEDLLSWKLSQQAITEQRYYEEEDILKDVSY